MLLDLRSLVEGSVTHSLSVEAGSYALTGSDATVKHAYVVAAGVGSYALTGTAASVLHKDIVTAGAGSYALTGTAATVKHGYVVAAGAGATRSLVRPLRSNTDMLFRLRPVLTR
jgi:hypothetical protein